MAASLGIGVVGIGFGQHVHVPVFRSDSRCQVVALCASSGERTRAIAHKLAIPKAYSEWQELLSDPAVDAISIAVPPVVQAPLVIAAAKAGKPVFCEKPVAESLAGADAMLSAVRQAQVPHAVNFLFPEIAAWQEAKAILDRQTLGRIRHAALSWRVETYALRHDPGSWKLREQEGGGILNNFVSHCLFYLEWLFGPIRAAAARLDPPPPASDVHVEAWLDFDSGLPLSLSVAGNAFLGSGHRLEIYGEDGTLVLENSSSDHVRGFRLWLGTRQSGALAPVPLEGIAEEGDGRVHAAARIAHRFIDAVLGRGTANPNLTHGVRVQHLIHGLREAERTGRRQLV